MYIQKLDVLAGIVDNRVIEPYLFNVTLTGEQY